MEGNLERALSEEPRPGAERKLTGKEEALLVATACAKPPVGRKRWTLTLLADAMVKLTDHDGLSGETVRRRLAENDLKPWRRDMWCIPHVDGEALLAGMNATRPTEDISASAQRPGSGLRHDGQHHEMMGCNILLAEAAVTQCLEGAELIERMQPRDPGHFRIQPSTGGVTAPGLISNASLLLQQECDGQSPLGMPGPACYSAGRIECNARSPVSRIYQLGHVAHTFDRDMRWTLLGRQEVLLMQRLD